MFTVSNTLLMSCATVIVRSGGLFLLKPVTMVLPHTPFTNHYLLVLFIPMWDIRPLTDHGHGPVTYLDVL